MVSIPACHAGDRGSIPRRGAFFHALLFVIQTMKFENFGKLASDAQKEYGAARHQERSRSVWSHASSELRVPNIDGELRLE